MECYHVLSKNMILKDDIKIVRDWVLTKNAKDTQYCTNTCTHNCSCTFTCLHHNLWFSQNRNVRNMDTLIYSTLTESQYLISSYVGPIPTTVRMEHVSVKIFRRRTVPLSFAHLVYFCPQPANIFPHLVSFLSGIVFGRILAVAVTQQAYVILNGN